ncbi:uncharacterized protein METZ01_LOCUS368711, partial [marine metagenome]
VEFRDEESASTAISTYTHSGLGTMPENTTDLLYCLLLVHQIQAIQRLRIKLDHDPLRQHPAANRLRVMLLLHPAFRLVDCFQINSINADPGFHPARKTGRSRQTGQRGQSKFQSQSPN